MMTYQNHLPIKLLLLYHETGKTWSTQMIIQQFLNEFEVSFDKYVKGRLHRSETKMGELWV